MDEHVCALFSFFFKNNSLSFAQRSKFFLSKEGEKSVSHLVYPKLLAPSFPCLRTGGGSNAFNSNNSLKEKPPASSLSGVPVPSILQECVVPGCRGSANGCLSQMFSCLS